MRYAIISDIHGNLEALNAVLKDIELQKIDRIICLGDIISKGTHNSECLELVRTVADAIVCGNNDLTYTRSLDELALESQDFDYDKFYAYQKQLTAEDISFIRSLPMCCEFMLSGRLIRCFHASQNDVDLSIFDFDHYHKKLELFNPSQYTTNGVADVVIYGHTHHMFYQKLFGRTLINAGSVGNALNVVWNDSLNSPRIGDFTMAEYVILTGEDCGDSGEIGVEFRSIPYDKNKEINSSPLTHEQEKFNTEIRTGKYRFPERIPKLI